MNKHHPQNIRVESGLYLQIDRWRVESNSPLGNAISQVRSALGRVFPDGPPPPARILIKRMTYKILRLEAFENYDYHNADDKEWPRSMHMYITLSNSLRSDAKLLMEMAREQEVKPSDPDLQEYLDTIKKAAKAQVVKVDKE